VGTKFFPVILAFSAGELKYFKRVEWLEELKDCRSSKEASAVLMSWVGCSDEFTQCPSPLTRLCNSALACKLEVLGSNLSGGKVFSDSAIMNNTLY